MPPVSAAVAVGSVERADDEAAPESLAPLAGTGLLGSEGTAAC